MSITRGRFSEFLEEARFPAARTMRSITATCNTTSHPLHFANYDLQNGENRVSVFSRSSLFPSGANTLFFFGVTTQNHKNAVKNAAP
jgi:hypothetical protein